MGIPWRLQQIPRPLNGSGYMSTDVFSSISQQVAGISLPLGSPDSYVSGDWDDRLVLKSHHEVQGLVRRKPFGAGPQLLDLAVANGEDGKV